MRLISPDKDMLRHAGELAERHVLRGYDAVHLATSLTVSTDSLLMVTWADDLAEAALAEGCSVAGGATT